ncbi:MAG: substrate-binding domain-containing protein [Bacteroidetes bacterium]|nr:substrate-binding domain-containing protein [Bacteroidota bacterium]
MKLFFATIIGVVFFTSCGMQDDITKKDTPTSGKANLFFDEGLTLHINNQIYTFKTTYKYADITLRSSNERECIEALYNDSSKVIAISRPLTEKELQQFKTKNIIPQTSVVAGDAIAFIVSKEFADSTISLQELTELLKGNDSTLIKGQHIKVVFDNPNSGSTRQLKDSLIPSGSFGKNCTALNNTEELVKAVASDSVSIGVCDYAWLSDKDDTKTKEFLKTVKILAVSKTSKETAYMPDQSNIATKAYPLCRSICIIRRSAEFSLGKGIETFIAGPTGQLMFLKQGLPPNRQEERLIEVDMTPLK